LLGVGFSEADGIDVFPFSISNPADISGDLVISGKFIGNLTGTFRSEFQIDSVQANRRFQITCSSLAKRPGLLATSAVRELPVFGVTNLF
jgi:hypothetical protein